MARQVCLPLPQPRARGHDDDGQLRGRLMLGAARDTHYAKGSAPALRYVAAALAFASELIHLWVVPGQLVAAMLPGAFFLLVAVCQGFLGASLLFGADKWTLRLGILLNASVILA